MQNNIFKTNFLLKTNIQFTILLSILNIADLYISGGNKEKFILFTLFINVSLFFLYRIKLAGLIDRYWLNIKKEILYINYPYLISGFFILMLIVLIANILILAIINKDALNSAFISTFFVSTIIMLTPSILFLLYIYIINPAFIIPAYERNKKKSEIIILCLFIIFLTGSVIKFTVEAINSMTVNKREKFKAVKLPLSYSTQYLKYKDLTPERIKILSHDNIKTPFYYTSESFKYNTYEEADFFCKSINARIPNYLEIYNIIFNRFDTFGEKYYWTSDYAGKYNLVLHFKNMTYEIQMKPKDVTPVLYCISEEEADTKLIDKKYFYKIKPINQDIRVERKDKKEFKFPPDINNIKTTIENSVEQTPQIIQKMPSEIRHVNFSVKHVSEDVFNSLIAQGYNYNRTSKPNPYYESSDNEINQRILSNADSNEIKLCYFPFTDNSNISKQNEIEIWKQSFCSPAFEVINQIPILKSGYEKDAYCMAQGGRLPNIPELTAILKTYRINNPSVKYWTNNTVSNNNEILPLSEEYQSSGFIKPVILSKTDKALTYCIKKSKQPSKVISNYQSKFYGEYGSKYSQRLCPSCVYYEMPDTVLIQ